MSQTNRYRELITFCNILSISLRSGKPLPDSMADLAGRAGSNQSAVWCHDLGKKLAEGYSPEDACRELAGFDNVLARLMPLLGEKRLIRVLEIYTLYLVNMATVKEQLSSLIFYPMIVLGLIMANLIHLNLFLFPVVYQEIATAGGSAPLMMRILYFAKVDLWPFSLVVPIFMGVCFGEMIRVVFTAKISSSSFIARLFGISSAIRLQETSRLQGIISLYLQSGFPLEKAVAMAAEFAEGSDKEALGNVAENIARGTDLESAFSHSQILADLQTTPSGSEDFAGRLKYLSDSNNRHSTASIKRFSADMFVMILLLTGLFVLVITSSFFDSYYWIMWSMV